MESGEGDRCPECAGELVRDPRGVEPWCSACEWNLGAFDPRPYRPRGWIARRSHRLAFALDARLAREMASHRPGKPPLSAPRVALMALTVLITLVVLVLAALGVWAVVDGTVPEKVLGVVSLLVAVELRPRIARSPRYGTAVDRDDAPELWRLVDGAADALGAPRMTRIVLVDDFTAAAYAAGPRRRPVLVLGILLWGCLGDDARLALLGHELGHFVNGDPTRTVLGQPATATFGRLSAMLHPDRGRSTALTGARSGIGVVVGFADLISRHLIARPLSAGFRVLHLGVASVAARDRMRAEYYADALALRLGGSRGATELIEVLVLSENVRSALASASRRAKDSSQWREAVEGVLEYRRPRIAVAEQASLRYDASLFASHPPAGRRLRAMRGWALTAVPRADIRPAAEDAVLTRARERVARDLALS